MEYLLKLGIIIKLAVGIVIMIQVFAIFGVVIYKSIKEKRKTKKEIIKIILESIVMALSLIIIPNFIYSL